MALAGRRIICSCIRCGQPTIRPVSAQRRVRKGQSTRQREKGRSGRRASGAGCKVEGPRPVASSLRSSLGQQREKKIITIFLLSHACPAAPTWPERNPILLEHRTQPAFVFGPTQATPRSTHAQALFCSFQRIPLNCLLQLDSSRWTTVPAGGVCFDRARWAWALEPA